MDRLKALVERVIPGKKEQQINNLDQAQLERQLRLAESPDPDIRERAANAMAKLPSDRAGETLAQLVKDREPDVRAAAADSIRAIAGKARVPVTPVMDALQLEPPDSPALYPLVGALRALGPGTAAERVVTEKMGWGMSRAKQAKIDQMIVLRETAAELTPHPVEVGPPFDAIFEQLTNEDPDIRADARNILAENRYVTRRLWSIYNELKEQEPRRAMLAGRVIGHRLNPRGLPKIKSDVTMHKLGVPIAFVKCACAYCGHENPNIPVPSPGLEVPFRGMRNRSGSAYTLPVLCDFCGNWFYVGFERDPRVPE